MLNFLNRFKYYDVPLTITAILLSVVGLTLLYSTSLASDLAGTLWRQLAFYGIGVIAFLFFSFFDYHTLAKGNRFIYVVFVLLLMYLLVFGRYVQGGRRWINLGLFNFQVAEFMKIVALLGLGRLMYLQRGQINAWKNILWSLMYAGIPALLIIAEPDLGSALVIVTIWAGIILISPIQKRFLAAILIGFLVVAGFTWQFALKPFQRARIEVFLDPALDPRGRGYNVRQAAIAVGSGQLFGRGLGKGLQSQNKFLPERQTDFVFAASSEQVGFIGSTVLLALYLFLLIRLLTIISRSKDTLGMYLAGGVFFLFFAHIIINIGMNIGLLPVTGIPLPFISAGGSSLIVTFIALGIVQNVAIQSKALRF